MLFEALTLQLGYNATLVAIGATALGIAAGVCGAFLYLRQRALVSDAISHATLPGLGLAFMVMVALGFDGRWLPGLLLGSALSAGLGLWWLSALARHKRLGEDAAIGAVLSVFFGFGVVLLTLIQTMQVGRQAGLEGFVLGSTAGMLRADAWVLCLAGGLAMAIALALSRGFLAVAFDRGYAISIGMPVARLDAALLALTLGVTVIGLKIVGLILIVALLIIPATAARLWSDRTDRMLWAAGCIGGASGYIGTAFSAAIPNLPTGPMVVLVAFAAFVISLIFAPGRGVLSRTYGNASLQQRVHLRQGLLAIAQGQDILEGKTRRLLERRGYLRRDGVATDAGLAAAQEVVRDEARWRVWRHMQAKNGQIITQLSLQPITDILTADEIALIDRDIGLKAVT